MKTLRIFILCSLFFLIARPAVSQNRRAVLHSVLVGDCGNPETGRGHRSNLERMEKEIKRMAEAAGMKPAVLRIDSVNFPAVQLTDRIRKTEIDSADAFIFYFSGSEYLRFVREEEGRNMVFADTYLSVGAVARLLESKNTRLFIILTDLCNRAGKFSADLPGESILSDTGYVRLFQENKGKVIIDNHEKKDQSHGGIGEKGSIFTAGLVQALREAGEWQTIADRSRALTIYASRGAQNPQASAKISSSDLIEEPEKEIIKPLKLRVLTENIPVEKTEKPQAVREVPSFSFMMQNGTERLSFWQNALSTLSDGPAASRSDEARRRQEIKKRLIELFAADSSVLIEVQGERDRSFFVSPKTYLDRIEEEVTAAYRKSRGWYRPAEIGPFTETAEGFFRAEAILFAETRLVRNSDGKVLTINRCEHSVELLVRPDEQNNWRVFPRNIRIRPGSCRDLETDN